MPCVLGWRQTFYYNRFPRLGLTVTTEVLDLDLSLHPLSATFTLTVNDGTPALT
jgi:hypothetical protein